MTARRAPSLRRRLVVQLLALAAVLAVLLFAAVRFSAERASEATLDAILGAATIAMAEEIRSAEGGAVIDLSPGTFSMLAAMGDERIFYRVNLGAATLTGYDDLPLPEAVPAALAPMFYSTPYRDTQVRIAAVSRSLRIDNRPATLLVLVGQTRAGQSAIAQGLANRAAAVGLVVFLLAVPLSLLAADNLLRPIARLAAAVGRRGPHDLRPVRAATPAELVPLVVALNSFIARLRGTLAQTETFIAEAAHHIRTPLAVMRTEAEMALHHSGDEATRARLRRLIRAVDDSARSAGQLLDHATVLYRADQQTPAEVELGALALALIERFRPTAEMKDMRLTLVPAAVALWVHGDAVLIEAALRNLIDNAIKYSPAETEVTLTLAAQAGQAVIRCRDHGRGVAGARLEALTSRFQRGPNVGDVAGSGLGLTIVSEAMAAMGGDFALDAAEGEGTCATLSLPLRAA
ncbi:MAG: sensor histidine kinase [Rhodobacterales bacterium]|nr:sensor histidine kinase [Rhodobacterales bacterium]